jgi:hypothetical protein
MREPTVTESERGIKDTHGNKVTCYRMKLIFSVRNLVHHLCNEFF